LLRRAANIPNSDIEKTNTNNKEGTDMRTVGSDGKTNESMIENQINPYRNFKSDLSPQVSEENQSLGCLATLFFADVIGVGVAVIVGEALAFFALMPPMNRWLSMNGEFDGLLLIGMPIWAGGFSLIASTVLGGTFPRKYAANSAIVVGSILTAAFFAIAVIHANRPSEWYSAFTVSVILQAAMAVGVIAAHKGLKRINRIRTRPTSGGE
jgi:O-antigen/teichoic acid export membrane protein